MDEDLGLFTCPRMPGGLRLMPKSCASYYIAGKRAEPWETVHHCQGCEIGARHAGESVVAKPVEHHCAACGSPSPRMIFGVVCVSCFNRLAEAIRGRNARGKPPRKWGAVRMTGLVAVVRGGLVFVGTERVKLIGRAPGVLLGPQRFLIETIGRPVNIPCPPCHGRIRHSSHGKKRHSANQWPLFD